MKRRWFLRTVSAGLPTAPFAVEAQQTAKASRIGILCAVKCSGSPLTDGFRQRLRELGWLEGSTIRIETRAAEGQLERLPDLASELLQLNVDVLVAISATTVMPAAKATTSVPVVFFGVSDPVKLGIVRSLAHPGGNVTGFTYTASYEYFGKQLEFLKMAVPQLRRVSVIYDLQESRPNWWPILEQAGRALNVDITPPLRVRGPETFQDAIVQSARMRSGGVIITSASTTYAYRELLTEQLLRARLPSIAGLREFAEAGGILSYGINLRAVAMRLAEYVDRILRGATPGDLPVEQPTTFELVINLKTAKALGLTIPPSLLARADQVIE